MYNSILDDYEKSLNEQITLNKIKLEVVKEIRSKLSSYNPYFKAVIKPLTTADVLNLTPQPITLLSTTDINKLTEPFKKYLDTSKVRHGVDDLLYKSTLSKDAVAPIFPYNYNL
jgi:hypothetical protein